MNPGNDNEPRDAGNRRMTGARKYPLSPDRPMSADGTGIDQEAAKNRPRKPYGLTRPVNETSEETSQSDNVDQRSGR